MSFSATWMDLKIIILNEVCQKRKTNTVWYHLHVESKIQHKWTYLWNRNRLTESKLVVAKVGGQRGGLGVWDQQIETSICRMNKQQEYSVQNRGLYSVSCDKLQWERIWKIIYICITESLCCTEEINTML